MPLPIVRGSVPVGCAQLRGLPGGRGGAAGCVVRLRGAVGERRPRAALVPRHADPQQPHGAGESNGDKLQGWTTMSAVLTEYRVGYIQIYPHYISSLQAVVY